MVQEKLKTTKAIKSLLFQQQGSKAGFSVRFFIRADHVPGFVGAVAL
jgi:hypothetical protein